MEVRLLKHWNGYAPGKILCAAQDGMANVLVKRGMAEEVTDGAKAATEKPSAVETGQAAAGNPVSSKKRKASKAASN